MMDVESAYTEFISCDRTGRRNAVPNIEDEGTTSVKDLSENMGDLKIQGTGELTGEENNLDQIADLESEINGRIFLVWLF
uniref:cAMP-dependent protein kinase inhibitor gamma n=1 Tax=Leptobrachium leishanense TaxID=445787 RepID=A0A8C5WFS1_9ANUR